MWEREIMLKQEAKLDMTFESFFEIYEADKKKRVKENTWESKSHVIRTKILPYFGQRKILGAADGAFVMQKEKRTENKAVLEVAGRDQQDQQDQRLLLNFNRELCLWELTKAETELWKEPDDPVLEAIAKVVSEEQQEWSGTATDLLQQLPELTMQPNVLTRKLNISMERLYVDYHINYESAEGMAVG